MEAFESTAGGLVVTMEMGGMDSNDFKQGYGDSGNGGAQMLFDTNAAQSGYDNNGVSAPGQPYTSTGVNSQYTNNGSMTYDNNMMMNQSNNMMMNQGYTSQFSQNMSMNQSTMGYSQPSNSFGMDMHTGLATEMHQI